MLRYTQSYISGLEFISRIFGGVKAGVKARSTLAFFSIRTEFFQYVVILFAMHGAVMGQARDAQCASTLPSCDFFQHVARHAERKFVLAQKYCAHIFVPQQRCLFLAMGAH